MLQNTGYAPTARRRILQNLSRLEKCGRKIEPSQRFLSAEPKTLRRDLSLDIMTAVELRIQRGSAVAAAVAAAKPEKKNSNNNNNR